MLDKNYENTNGKSQHTNQADKKNNQPYKNLSSILEKIDNKRISEKPASRPMSMLRHSLQQRTSYSKAIFA